MTLLDIWFFETSSELVINQLVRFLAVKPVHRGSSFDLAQVLAFS
jgi:hypothetical protein